MLAAHTACQGLGSRIIVSDVPSPRITSHQILIANQASSINPLDTDVYRALRRVPLNKIVLGHDMAGVITQVGSAVTQFKVGDEVYGCLPGAFGGAFAERVRAPASAVALKPKNLSMQEAAAIPLVALTVMQALRKTGIQAGESLLVIGASGGVGTMAVQIAKALGIRMTGVCSTANVELVKNLGADAVIDYTRQSLSEVTQKFHMIFDVIGSTSLGRCRHLLQPGGNYLALNPSTRSVTNALMRRRAHLMFMKPIQADLEAVTHLIETGKVKPVIDRQFRLSDIEQACAYSQTKRARGKIVLDLTSKLTG